MDYWIFPSLIQIKIGKDLKAISPQHKKFEEIKALLEKGNFVKVKKILNPKMPPDFRLDGGRIFYKTCLLPDSFSDLIQETELKRINTVALANAWWNLKTREKIDSLGIFSQILEARLRPITECGFHYVGKTQHSLSIAMEKNFLHIYNDEGLKIPENMLLKDYWKKEFPKVPLTNNLLHKHILGGTKLNAQPFIYYRIKEAFPDIVPNESPLLLQDVGLEYNESTIAFIFSLIETLPKKFVRAAFINSGFSGIERLSPAFLKFFKDLPTPNKKTWEALFVHVEVLKELKDRPKKKYPKYKSFSLKVKDKEDKPITLNFRTPEDNWELIQWSLELRNCAKGIGYEEEILEGKAVLFGAFVKERLVALSHFNKAWEVVQFKMKNNNPVPHEWHEALKNCTLGNVPKKLPFSKGDLKVGDTVVGLVSTEAQLQWGRSILEELYRSNPPQVILPRLTPQVAAPRVVGHETPPTPIEVDERDNSLSISCSRLSSGGFVEAPAETCVEVRAYHDAVRSQIVEELRIFPVLSSAMLNIPVPFQRIQGNFIVEPQSFEENCGEG